MTSPVASFFNLAEHRGSGGRSVPTSGLAAPLAEGPFVHEPSGPLSDVESSQVRRSFDAGGSWFNSFTDGGNNTREGHLPLSAAPLLQRRASDSYTEAGGGYLEADQADDLDDGGSRRDDSPVGQMVKELSDVRGYVFGAVNTIVSLPSMVAFANIIFKSPKFAPWMPILVRLLFLSAGVHQLAFVVRSRVPGAIGQVQDVGLIFLSAMTTSIVAYGEENSLPFTETVSTVLLVITSSTAIVGILILLLAKFRVARLVQYVPVPVVGGYLAFVGYFCCFAGVALAANVNMETLADWQKVLNLHALLRILPMLGTWLVLHLTVHYVSHPLGLPAAICSIPALFFVILYATGHTLEDAQKAEWTPAPVEGGAQPFWEAWEMFDFGSFPNNIHWPAVFRQVPNLLALFFVVAFGSCMDIAAIQAECPFQLDFDRELGLIGISNALCGVVGAGFTGSYIFSQTLFNVRWGAWGKMVGVVVALSEIALFLAPVSTIQYIPNFFFGGLMFWFGVDIAVDWLVAARKRVKMEEYVMIWASFAAVTAFGLEAGIALGCVLAALQFTWEYARLSSSSITVVNSLSANMRTYDQRTVLQLLQDHFLTVTLNGYVFFGSALRISTELQDLAERMSAGRKAASGSFGDNSAKFQIDMQALHQASPSFLLLDFRRIRGFDASSAQAFCTAKRKLAALGVQLIICAIPAQAKYILRLLQANGVVSAGEDGETSTVFTTLDEGLRHCEDAILAVSVQQGVCRQLKEKMSFSEVLEAHLSFPSLSLPGMISYELAASKILPYLSIRDIGEGENVFSYGDKCDELYIIHSGQISCEIDFSQWTGALTGVGPGDVMPQSTAAERRKPLQFLQYGPGGILGDTDFFLQQPHSFRAWCSAGPCRLWSLSNATVQKMLKNNPSMLVVIQALVLRSQCMTAKHSMGSLEMLAMAH